MVELPLVYLFSATTLIAVAVLLQRVKAAEVEVERLRSELSGRAAPEAEDAPLLESETRALYLSPVSVILAECELARGEGRMDARLETIERCARRVADLLERQRLPGDTLRRETRELDPSACVRAAIGTFAGLALERGVKVHVMTEETPRVRAVPALLAHALRNLVRAAVEAAPRGCGDVTVATGVLPPEGEPEHVAVAVADDGPGIEPARLIRILAGAGAADDAPPRPEELAYSIVHAVAIAMGARFVVDSAPGAGTRATLKLPLVRAQQKRSTARVEPALAGST